MSHMDDIVKTNCFHVKIFLLLLFTHVHNTQKIHILILKYNMYIVFKDSIKKLKLLWNNDLLY